MLSKYVDDTKLGEIADNLQNRIKIQKDLYKLGNWPEISGMTSVSKSRKDHT